MIALFKEEIVFTVFIPRMPNLLMRLADIKRWLRKYNEENITLTFHVTHEKCPYYGIKPKIILDNLLNPSNLIGFKKSSININESKYKLYFKLSGQRTITLVVEFNEKLRVITIYLIRNKWQKRLRLAWKR